MLEAMDLFDGSAFVSAKPPVLPGWSVPSELSTKRVFEVVGCVGEALQTQVQGWRSRISVDSSFVSERVRTMVEDGQLDEARRLAETMTRLGVNLGGWSRALEEPVVTARERTGRGDLRANMEWVEANRDEYRGRWVALAYGSPVASHETRRGLLKQMADSGNVGRALVLFVGP